MTATLTQVRRSRVLLADDTPDIRAVLRTYLAGSGDLEVVAEASDGAEAVELAVSEQPDLIVLDLSMPVMDGLEAIPRIREVSPAARILVFSGVSRARAEEASLRLGADAYLEKPASLGAVVTTLRRLRDGTRPAEGSTPNEEDLGTVPADAEGVSLIDLTDPAEPTAPVFARRVAADGDGRDAPVEWSGSDLQLAAQHAPIGLALVGLDGRWLRVNAALCRITGRSEQELLELTFQDITHPEDLDADLQNLARLLDGAVESYEMEKRYIHAGGHAIPILLTVSLVRSAEGQPRYFVAQIQDISARKRAERELTRTMAELERSNRELQRFAALVSHDLRSPLSVVRGAIDLIANDHARNPDPGRSELEIDLLSRASRQVDKALGVLDALRALASAQSEPLRREVVDLGELLTTVVETLDPDPAARISGELPVAWGDRALLGVLLENLVQNGLKYRRPGTPARVEVSAVHDGRSWTITVEDDGIGVAPELRERIFEPFVRSPDVHDTPGSGIGLATCARIVERHGGRIWVEEAPTGGSRFRFTLPIGPPRTS